MRVYNLMPYPLDFKKQTLAPNGGVAEFPELDTFVPDKEKRLAAKGVISFGSLPKGWKPKK